MARHLLDSFTEKRIHDMKWKHGDAMTAVLGERISAGDFNHALPNGHHGTFRSLHVNWKGANEDATSRPVVSWLLNRVGKVPSHIMGTETCAMHEIFPPRKEVDVLMDGCRFRDDMVSAFMTSRAFPGEFLFKDGAKIFSAYGSVDRRASFYPKRDDDDDSESLDDGKFDTMFRFFSAFPGKLAPLLKNPTIVAYDITTDLLSRSMEKIADKYLDTGNAGSSPLKKGMEILFQFAPTTLSDKFFGTRNPILARGVAIAATRELRKKYGHGKKHREAEQFGRIQSIADDVAKMNNPAIGDAIVGLLVEGSNSIPKDVRCLVASDISTRKTGTERIKYILASEQGERASDEYYEKNCGKDKQ